MRHLNVFHPTRAIALGMLLSGLLLTATLHAQERGPSVSVRIIHTGTVQGVADVIPPQQRPGQQVITYPRDTEAERLHRAGLTPGTLDGVPREMQVRAEITFAPGEQQTPRPHKKRDVKDHGRKEDTTSSGFLATHLYPIALMKNTAWTISSRMQPLQAIIRVIYAIEL